MGAELSKTLRSDLEVSTLEALLSNEEYIQQYGTAFHALNESAQSAFKTLLKSKPTTDRLLSNKKRVKPQEPNVNQKKKKSRRRDKLWQLRQYSADEVKLPTDIVDLFNQWKAEPHTFLCTSALHIPSSLAEFYGHTCHVQSSLVSNEVVWRFVTTTYYDVMSALSMSDRYDITAEAVAFVAAFICDSSTKERDSVERNLSRWAEYGKRHRALANSLGGTSCYFFYRILTVKIWVGIIPQETLTVLSPAVLPW